MSEEQDVLQGEVLEPEANGTSLEARMRARRNEVEGLTSQKFPLPRYEEVASVELRYLGFERQRNLYERSKRQRSIAIRELYTAADQLLAATVGFYEMHGAEDDEGTSVDYTWVTLARAVLGDQLRDDATPRQALLALISPEGVPALWNDWQEWMGGQRPDVDREVASDFPTTR